LYVDSEITGTVLSATPRVVGNNRTIYDIAFSDGNTYTTFDAKIWAKVQQVGQQPATARVSVKQKDQFTNFYLNDIAPQGQLAATSAPVATPPPPQAARAPQSGGMSPEREQKIVKQSSFSTAFNFVGALYQGAGDERVGAAIELAHNIAKELYGHAKELYGACDERATAGRGSPSL
jgi:hypothetical protein